MEFRSTLSFLWLNQITSSRLFQSVSILLMIVALTACGGSSDAANQASTPGKPDNTAPTVSNLVVTDDNGDSTLVGDTLTATYDYKDADGDLEGSSSYQWLRNASPIIDNANERQYTVVTADIGKILTFKVTPKASTGIPIGTTLTSAEISIAPMVVLSIDKTSITEASTNNTATLTASLADAQGNPSPFTQPVTVNLTYSGTAIPGATNDYTKSDNIVIPAGAGTGTATIIAVEDTTIEGDESFNVAIGSVTAGTVGTANSIDVTIIENDFPQVSFSTSNQSVTEGAGTGLVTITVSLSQAIISGATVDYATVDNTAKAGTDFIAKSGTVSFSPGETLKAITIPIIDDFINEPDESFNVVLSNAKTASVVTTTSIVTIADDDIPLASLFSDVNLQNCVGTLAAANGWTVTTKVTGALNCASMGIGSIEGIQYLTNLTELDISNNTITNIAPLSTMVKLTSIIFGDNCVADISALAGLKQLTRIIDFHSTVDTCATYIADISALSGLTNLTYLQLSGENISYIAPVSGLTKLAELHLNNNHINDINALSSLVNLVFLDLRNNNISDIGGLSNLINLKILDAESNSITDISPLATLTSLTSIYAYNNQISDLSALTNLTKLQYIELRSNGITDIAPLRGLNQLYSLKLSENTINTLTPIADVKYPKLTILELDHNQIVDVSPLNNKTSLIGLGLSGNQIQDVAPLASLINLTSLALHFNSIQGQNLGNIDSLVSLTNLTLLWVHSNINISCQELSTLILKFNNTSAVVLPATAIDGADCTAP